MIQEREVRKVGGIKTTPINTRIISATNRNLFQMVKKGEFRKDLFYRINVLPLEVISLNKRPEDIIPLLDFFLIEYNLSSTILSDKVILKLENYAWPGNVRELENFSNYLASLTQIRDVIKGNFTEKVLEYFRNFNGTDILPDKGNIPYELEECYEKLEKKGFLNEYIAILNLLKKSLHDNEVMSRKKIQKELDTKFGLSLQQIRNKMNHLYELGLVSIGRTKQGTKITEQGIKFLEFKAD
ncbi:hypothetical protein GCM10008931_03690 [Oceanobacillus oncorhynchi subsp. oncorhynchi]